MKKVPFERMICKGQMSIFDFLYPKQYKIDKPIRLIELFAGYGSQNLALKYIGADYESHKICEWAVKSIQAYKDLHCADDNTDYSRDLTIEQVQEYLYQKGISMDYNQPMTREQIKRLGQKARTIYNNIKATKNLVNIQQVKGKDLEITKTDKYCYVMTYSYPCQDLSLAGKQLGMSEESGTRSSMLWQVKRILTELSRDRERERDCLPQILIMENVTQVHSKKNKQDFDKWCKFLDSLGYSNFWKDLNGKDFGIPQNRNRTFMVSILGLYDYKFPEKIELTKTIKNILETDVPEKYYLSDKMINCFTSDGTGKYPRKERFLQNINRKNQNVANSITTLAGSRPTDNYIIENLSSDFKREVANRILESNLANENDIIDVSYCNERLNEIQNGYVQVKNSQDNTIANTITTQSNNMGIVVKDKLGNEFTIRDTKQLRETIEQNELRENTCLDLYNRTIHNDISQTLDTGYHNSQRVCVNDEKIVGCAIRGRYDENGNIVQKVEMLDEEISNALTSSFSGKVNQICNTKNLRIRKFLPIECFRLMGVKDDDFKKIEKNQSDSSLYHLAGDSIITFVLCAIFLNLLDTDKKLNDSLEEFYKQIRRN